MLNSRPDARRHRQALLGAASDIFLEFGITAPLELVVARSGLATPLAWLLSPALLDLGEWRTLYMFESGPCRSEAKSRPPAASDSLSSPSETSRRR